MVEASKKQMNQRAWTWLCLAAGAALGISLWAEEPWKKPPSQWTDEEALQVVRDSPWANEEFLAKPLYVVVGGVDTSTNIGEPRTGGRRNPTLPLPPQMERPPDPNRPLPPPKREDFTLASYLVRWESSRTVQAAFARLRELGLDTTAEFHAPAPQAPEDRYVVTVKTTGPASRGPDLFEGLKPGELLLRARLRTRQGEVAPAEVQRSGKGANAAVHFLFPREVKGKPLLQGEKERAEFEFQGLQFNLKSKFELEPDEVQ